MDRVMGAPRVLIVHDQPLVYEGTAEILRRDGGCQVSGRMCHEDQSGPEPLEPDTDVVVIAFTSGAEPSIEWARTIEHNSSGVGTVVLVGTPTARLLRHIAHASMCSVLHQRSSPATLVQAVRAAAIHQRYFCPVVAEALMHVVADGV